MPTNVSNPATIHLRVASETFANETQFLDRLDTLLVDVDVEFVYMPDYWPFVDGNGEWAGALAAVRDGTVDTLYELLYVTTARHNAFSFTNPIIQTEYATLYAHEPPAMLHFENLSAGIDYSRVFINCRHQFHAYSTQSVGRLCHTGTGAHIGCSK